MSRDSTMHLAGEVDVADAVGLERLGPDVRLLRLEALHRPAPERAGAGEQVLVDLRRRAPGARRRPGERRRRRSARQRAADQARLVGRPGEQAGGDRYGRRCRCGHGISPRPTQPQLPHRCQQFLMMIFTTTASGRCTIIIRIPSRPRGSTTVAARRSRRRRSDAPVEHDRRAAHAPRGARRAR